MQIPITIKLPDFVEKFDYFDFEISYYLSHAFRSRKEMRWWELGFEKRTGIKLINPFYDVERPDIKEIDDLESRQEKLDKLKHIDPPDIIVPCDLYHIYRTKGGVYIIDKNIRVGALQEMVYGKMFGKKVYSVVTNGEENHPWILYHSNKIFTNLNALEEFLIKNG